MWLQIMTLLYDDVCFLKHETGNHPEKAARIREIPGRLEEAGLSQRCRRVEWEPISRARLARIHSPSYVDEIWALSKSGGGEIDADTPVSPESYDVALMAAGSVCDATERLVRGEHTNALCLVRPPGHHAMVNRGMGFCLFNNVAAAASLAIWELGLQRVLIVDFDVHHGNGTQATFWHDPRVGFLSIHRWPFFPGTGAAEETGTGDGLGTTLNLPVEFGVSRHDYLEQFSAALDKFASKIRPELVLVSAGFDTHRADPVGGLSLETEDFQPITRALLDVADTYAEGRLVSVLEGGYDPKLLADSVAVHLEEMVRRTEERGSAG